MHWDPDKATFQRISAFIDTMVKFFPLPNDEQIEDFENIILRQSHHFQNRDLIREALQLAGPLNPNGNRVLAQVGDAIIRLILVDQGRNKNKTPGKAYSLPIYTLVDGYHHQQGKFRN